MEITAAFTTRDFLLEGVLNRRKYYRENIILLSHFTPQNLKQTVFRFGSELFNNSFPTQTIPARMGNVSTKAFSCLLVCVMKSSSIRT